MNKLSKIKNLCAGFALSTALSGCASYNLYEFPKEVQLKVDEVNYETLDSYFTSSAALELEKIPVVRGETLANNNYAAGRNLAVMLVEYLFLGLGFERKTVVTNFFKYDKATFTEKITEVKNLGNFNSSEFFNVWQVADYNPEFVEFRSPLDVKIGEDAYLFWIDAKIRERQFKRVLLHENVHHASAIGLIDDSEFNKSWSIMEKTPKYKDLCERIDRSISNRQYSFWIDFFLIWRDLEREAELAELMVLDGYDVPVCMQRVYRKTFRKYEHLD